MIEKSVSKSEILDILEQIDSGQQRVAEKINGKWVVNQLVKQAILELFKMNDNQLLTSGEQVFYDKVPLKFANYSADDFKKLGIRVVPGAIVRKYCYIAPKVIVMPAFINLGAYIDEGTLIDSNVTIGSCAQIGKNCHISSGVNICGVLEPIQASPIIIEDNVLIGAGSTIAEGVIVEEGAVVSTGVHIGASTKIYDRETGEISYGVVPKNAVVISGVINSADGRIGQAAAIIVKRVDAKTRSKAMLNDVLRNND
ncbi:MAG: 2,3,4,5-tetrahydropyridine-2,6-dicarboxylate N-succinyltransferase [Rickettsiales bacterium]